ncbi:O-antigen ligase family protein [Parasphingorhabdus sp.]
MSIKSLLSSLTSPNGRFFALTGFLIIVFLMGGGSRPDIQSLVILRPLAFGFIAYALIVATREELKPLKIPLILLGLLGLLMFVQLLPMPQAFWEQLPSRKPIAEIAELAGMGELWRPISMVPSRTLNSLFSLSVPLAALLLCAIQAPQHGRRIVGVLILLGSFSALLGALQLAGSGQSALYLYRVTNADTPVGLLANRNHQAVLLASSVLMAAWYFVSFRQMPNRNLEWARIAAALSPLLFLPLIVLTGSRLGIIVGATAVFAAGLMVFYRGYVTPDSQKGSAVEKFIAAHRTKITIVAIVALVALLVLLFSDSLAIRRLVSAKFFEDLRADVFPVLLSMAKEHLVFGTGFGSFENVYRAYETKDLLQPNYLNNAHNDWLQYVIEAGLGGILIALGFLVWLVIAVWRGYSSGSVRKTSQTDMCLAIIAIIAMASIVDYPLRVPTIMVLMAFCVVRLARSSADQKQ